MWYVCHSCKHVEWPCTCILRNLTRSVAHLWSCNLSWSVRWQLHDLDWSSDLALMRRILHMFLWMLGFYLTLHLNIYPSIYLSNISIYLSIYLYLYISVFVYIYYKLSHGMWGQHLWRQFSWCALGKVVLQVHHMVSRNKSLRQVFLLFISILQGGLYHSSWGR